MKIAALENPKLEKHLSLLEADGLTIFTLGGQGGPSGGEVRGGLIHGTAMIAQMRANHGLGILETYLLGQAFLAAGLMASTLKDEERLALRMDCDGPVKGFSVEGRTSLVAGPPPRAEVRGYLFQDLIPLREEVKSFDTAPFVGQGSLTVTRFTKNAPRPFSGAVRLRTGRLAEDLAAYYLESEQTRTAFDLSIRFGRGGLLEGAGGLFLQALPGAREDFVSRVEAILLALPSLGAWFAEGKDRTALLRRVFASAGLVLLEGRKLAFGCDCSRERFAAFLSSSSEELLRDLAENGPWPVATSCHNCSSSYEFSREELQEMAKKRGIGLGGET